MAAEVSVNCVVPAHQDMGCDGLGRACLFAKLALMEARLRALEAWQSVSAEASPLTDA